MWEDLGSTTTSSAELVCLLRLVACLWTKVKQFASALEYPRIVSENVYVSAKQIL